MEIPYRAVQFAQYEPLTRDVMSQVSNNLQWIHDYTPRSRIINERRNDTVSTTDVRITVLFGRVDIGQSLKEPTVTKKVSFSTAFAPDCRPNVTTGIITQGVGGVFCVVLGPGDNNFPTAQGCQISVTAPDADAKEKKKEWAIGKPIFVDWQAHGYRAEGV